MTSGPVDEVNITQTAVAVKPKNNFFPEKQFLRESCLVNHSDTIQKIEALHEVGGGKVAVQQLMI